MKKKKNKTGKAERRTRKGGVRIPPWLTLTSLFQTANKNTGRAACEWQSGTNEVSPNICSEFRCGFARRLLNLALLALHVIHSKARAVPKEVLTPLLFLVPLLFSTGARGISLPYKLLCREVKPFKGFAKGASPSWSQGWALSG